MEKIIITFPDGNEKEFDKGISALEIAQSISQNLANEALAADIDGKLYDLNTKITGNSTVTIITFRNEGGQDIYWHSSAHIMADAVKQLFPEVKIAIGPAIENGFYYDFDRDEAFTEEDLEKIEKKMGEIIKEKHAFDRKEVSRDEAAKFFGDQGEIYKTELLSELEDDAVITTYTHNNFTDLCRGPHVPHTGRIKFVKLLSTAGAYWRGDENRKSLKRIYGISFPNKKDLKAYLNKLEEAKKRDHRKLGKMLDLFSVAEEVGPGLILWHPNGAILKNTIENFWREVHEERDYMFASTPHIARETMFEISGHLQSYSENMYAPMEIDKQKYRLKPMNCPGHILIYNSKLRSYKDLPMRICELGTVYRYERSGVLHGMLRVRGFTVDDGHIFCTQEQFKEEIIKTIDLADYMLKTFGYEYEVHLATRPEKYLGTLDLWEMATKNLADAMDEKGMEYKIDEGGGVFYGPKIDIKLIDAIGRRWQGPTIQLDFNLPQRFNITYIGEDGKEHNAVMIHRAVLGSMERFVGGLIEHYGGAFPFWLAPVQVVVIPITEKHKEYATEVYDFLKKNKIRAKLDTRSEKVGYKIREHETMKVPYMFVVGDQEAADSTVAVRKHGKKDLGTKDYREYLATLKELIDKRIIDK